MIEINKNKAENTQDFLDVVRIIAREFKENKESKFDLGLNIFTIASSRYYLEDFHSDVLVSLLEPNGRHKEGKLPMSLFFKLLNLQSGLNIDFGNYNSYEIFREQGRIDILIKDSISCRAIIIENKINNAVDQHLQLINYLKLIEGQGYTIDAVVYLTIDPFKKPDFTKWNSEDKANVEDKLIYLAVEDSRDGMYDLIGQWIDPLIIEANNLNLISILKQYKSLLLFLTKNKMDEMTLNKFYDQLKCEDNLETALSVKRMLEEFPQFLANRIQRNYFEDYSPFLRLWRWTDKKTVIFEDFTFQKNKCKLSIVSSLDGYEIFFLIREGEIKLDTIREKVPVLNDFNYDNISMDTLKKTFPPLKEEEVFAFVDTLLIELRKIQND